MRDAPKVFRARHRRALVAGFLLLIETPHAFTDIRTSRQCLQNLRPELCARFRRMSPKNSQPLRDKILRNRICSQPQIFDSPAAAAILFPQRNALGLDPRESTPGFKRQTVILNAETRSLKRAAIAMRSALGLQVSTNTIERITLEAGNDLEAAERAGWKDVLSGTSTP